MDMQKFKLYAAAALSAAFILVYQPLDRAADKAEAAKPQQTEKATKAELQSDPEYVIGTDDILEISVWKNPDLSKVVTVRPDGMVTLPLIGDLRAAGTTPSALRDRIVERLKEYQETAVASVIVQEVRSYRIFVLGEVLNPGTYVMTRSTTVLQAVALAGGFNPFASRDLVLVRERPDKNGKPEKISISFDDIVDEGEKADKNLILRPGDTIFAP